MYYGGRSHCISHKEFDVRLYDLKDKDNSNPEPVISATLINSEDSEGWTAAHIAASKGFKVWFPAALHGLFRSVIINPQVPCPSTVMYYCFSISSTII